MATQVTIIYTGPVADIVRQGMEIARYFEPQNSYIDSAVYTEGYKNEDGVGDGGTYGRSIYATNVDGWGFLPGLLPMASTTTKFAQFERAVYAAIKAKAEDAENKGITFEVEGYEEEIYWCQIAVNMVDLGFYTKVGDEEFGPAPEEDGEGGDDEEGG